MLPFVYLCTGIFFSCSLESRFLLILFRCCTQRTTWGGKQRGGWVGAEPQSWRLSSHSADTGRLRGRTAALALPCLHRAQRRDKHTHDHAWPQAQ